MSVSVCVYVGRGRARVRVRKSGLEREGERELQRVDSIERECAGARGQGGRRGC